MRESAPAWLLLAALASASAAERWDVQFFHDEDKSSMMLVDIAFPTPTRGIAVGVLQQEDRDRKPVVLVTSDGGARWTTLKAPDFPRSLFCLDETACWMAGTRGVWFSTETGRDWRKVLGSSQILKVHFLSRQHGFAAGGKKTLLETRDGGKTWKKPAVLAEVKASEDRMVFHAMHFFGGKTGLIAGRSEPRESERIPIWMDEDVEERKEVPALSVVLETRDAGETWKTSTASLFGRISQLQSTERGEALALFEFDRYFSFPSELIRIEMSDGRSQRVYREADTALTDVVVLPDGSAYAAGFEPPGRLARLPIPGKLKVLKSPDRQIWITMDVDYRAVARRAALASAGPDHVWLATDTGMILKLVRE